MEEYLPCSERLSLTIFGKDGSTRRVQQCGEQTAPKANQQITPQDCEACPVRKSVVEKARVSGAMKPPPKLDVLVASKTREPRADGYEDCYDRLRGSVPGCCGSVSYIRICDSPDSYRYGEKVSPVICAACPVRRAK